MTTLTIGKLARQVDIGVETLRYYEQRGLIAPITRTQAGYRIYAQETPQRLFFIRRAQTLGFSLDEIGELLSLSDQPSRSAEEVKRLTKAKIDDITARIRDLERVRQALTALESECPGHAATTAECPILAALNQSHIQTTDGQTL